MQGYNVQAAVDHESHMVVGQHVSQATNDKQEVEPALNELAKVEDTLGKPEAMPDTTAKRTWGSVSSRASIRTSRGAENATTSHWKNA